MTPVSVSILVAGCPPFCSPRPEVFQEQGRCAPRLTYLRVTPREGMSAEMAIPISVEKAYPQLLRNEKENILCFGWSLPEPKLCVLMLPGQRQLTNEHYLGSRAGFCGPCEQCWCGQTGIHTRMHARTRASLHLEVRKHKALPNGSMTAMGKKSPSQDSFQNLDQSLSGEAPSVYQEDGKWWVLLMCGGVRGRKTTSGARESSGWLSACANPGLWLLEVWWLVRHADPDLLGQSCLSSQPPGRLYVLLLVPREEPGQKSSPLRAC